MGFGSSSSSPPPASASPPPVLAFPSPASQISAGAGGDGSRKRVKMRPLAQHTMIQHRKTGFLNQQAAENDISCVPSQEKRKAGV